MVESAELTVNLIQNCIQRMFPRMPKRSLPNIVYKCSGFCQIAIKAKRVGNSRCELHDFDAVR